MDKAATMCNPDPSGSRGDQAPMQQQWISKTSNGKGWQVWPLCWHVQDSAPLSHYNRVTTGASHILDPNDCGQGKKKPPPPTLYKLRQCTQSLRSLRLL